MDSTEYRRLADHMEWADALIWKAVLALPAERHERLLLERLHHLHACQWAYLQLWRGEPLTVPEAATFPGLPELLAWAQPYYAAALAFVEATPDAAFAREFQTPWVEEIVKRFGSATPATLGDNLLQVVMHSAYHRGQIATRVRELGGEPPLTDYIAWIWLNRPVPAWA